VKLGGLGIDRGWCFYQASANRLLLHPEPLLHELKHVAPLQLQLGVDLPGGAISEQGEGR